MRPSWLRSGLITLTNNTKIKMKTIKMYKTTSFFSAFVVAGLLAGDASAQITANETVIYSGYNNVNGTNNYKPLENSANK